MKKNMKRKKMRIKRDDFVVTIDCDFPGKKVISEAGNA